MRPISPTRAELIELHEQARRDYLEWFQVCHVCGKARSTGVHEILDGCNRGKSFGQPEAWLSTCWGCNSGALKDATRWPKERQLALKLIVDPNRFDLAIVCEILGTDFRACPNAVTLEDVAKFLELKPHA